MTKPLTQKQVLKIAYAKERKIKAAQARLEKAVKACKDEGFTNYHISIIVRDECGEDDYSSPMTLESY